MRKITLIVQYAVNKSLYLQMNPTSNPEYLCGGNQAYTVSRSGPVMRDRSPLRERARTLTMSSNTLCMDLGGSVQGEVWQYAALRSSTYARIHVNCSRSNVACNIATSEDRHPLAFQNWCRLGNICHLRFRIFDFTRNVNNHS